MGKAVFKTCILDFFSAKVTIFAPMVTVWCGVALLYWSKPNWHSEKWIAI
jgi:hypothetical protein